MYKLFVETTSRRARIVPGTSRPNVAERVFGELSAEDALANRDSLEDAVRSILADKGILDGEFYSITLPDNLLPSKQGSSVQDNKGPISESEFAHEDVVPVIEGQEQTHQETEPTGNQVSPEAKKLEAQKETEKKDTAKT